MGDAIRAGDRRAKGDDSLVLTDNFLALSFSLFFTLSADEMQGRVCARRAVYLHAHVRACACVRACRAYPIIFESHLIGASVACHLRKMSVADIKGGDR